MTCDFFKCFKRVGNAFSKHHTAIRTTRDIAEGNGLVVNTAGGVGHFLGLYSIKTRTACFVPLLATHNSAIPDPVIPDRFLTTNACCFQLSFTALINQTAMARIQSELPLYSYSGAIAFQPVLSLIEWRFKKLCWLNPPYKFYDALVFDLIWTGV